MKNKMAVQSSVVMDVLPWPNGYGFSGGDEWWQYTLSQSERDRLDNLLGLALIDSRICEQLVLYRDRALFDAFELRPETQQWLSGLNINNLQELAQAILAAPGEYLQDAAEAA